MKNTPPAQLRYSFPTIRKGRFYGVPDVNDIEPNKLKNIVQTLKSDKERYVGFACNALKEHFENVTQKRVSDVHEDVYEGTAIHSPSFLCKTEFNGDRYQFNLASTIIVCMSPNKSKVWCRASLRKKGDVWANNLTIGESKKFFDKMESFLDSYCGALCTYYNECINDEFGRSNNWTNTFNVRTISSSNPDIGKLLEPIKHEEIFSVSDSFDDENKRAAILDHLLLSFDQHIDTKEKYRSLLEKYRTNWNDKKNRLPKKERGLNYLVDRNEDILSKGYQWFGFYYKDVYGLFLRKEDIDNKKATFYGVSSENTSYMEECQDNENKDPKSSSRLISGAVIRNYTRVE